MCSRMRLSSRVADVYFALQVSKGDSTIPTTVSKDATEYMTGVNKCRQKKQSVHRVMETRPMDDKMVYPSVYSSEMLHAEFSLPLPILTSLLFSPPLTFLTSPFSPTVFLFPLLTSPSRISLCPVFISWLSAASSERILRQK